MNLSKPSSKVVAVVVTFNGVAWVNTCLGSLVKSRYPVEIIVVDNSSSDNTTEIIEGNFTEVQLIKETVNHGFGQANNIGISLALNQGADYVFLINQDAWVKPDTIEILLRAHQNKPQYSILSPIHILASGRKLDPGFRSYLLRTYSETEVVGFENETEEKVAGVPFVNAAAWLVHKTCLKDTGGFGYLFYHYGEDRDYVQRCRFYGHGVAIVTRATIVHDRESRFDAANGLADTRNFRYYYTGVLARCTDINKSLFEAVLNGLGWSLKETVYHFFSGKGLVFPLLFFRIAGKIVFSMRGIVRYRAITRSHKPFLFLDFDNGQTFPPGTATGPS